jgi:alpha-galactosidase
MPDKGFVLIGAGSTVFTPGLLRDITSSRVFDDYTVHLVDLNGEAAETMAAIGRRLAAQQGSGVRFEAHTDRRAALPGARFVTTTIAVGAAAGWHADLEIPARYGIRQTVGDSVGPGGVLRALRHIPELVAIAGDVADLAPQAWLINYSNPLTANVRAITRETEVKTVGLCHGTMHTKLALSKALGLDSDAVHTVFAGLNHLCWLLDIRSGDTDGRLPTTAVVEVPAVVGADRITGLGAGPLPPAVAAVLTARADQQELTVQAGVTGDRDAALQALTLDPLVGDARTAAAILDGAVLAHAPCLDRFAC